MHRGKTSADHFLRQWYQYDALDPLRNAEANWGYDLRERRWYLQCDRRHAQRCFANEYGSIARRSSGGWTQKPRPRRPKPRSRYVERCPRERDARWKTAGNHGPQPRRSHYEFGAL